MITTVVVPTYNEAPNVAEVVRRVSAAVAGRDVELLFVDDSTDDTPAVIEAVASRTDFPVLMIHRDRPVGGLSGAVLDGIAASDGQWCVVMDGDLQHPPELIPVLLDAAESAGADVAVASRYRDGGSSDGLDGVGRRFASRACGWLARSLFPLRLRGCTDPMTGFFAVRRESLDVSVLQPRGFKILLEILARHRLRVVEAPLVFAGREGGESKASLSQGLAFLTQLADLRLGRATRFAAIGAAGTVANLAIMAALIGLGVGYVPAAAVAAIVTIMANFFLQDRFVFGDMVGASRGIVYRFVSAVGASTVEAALRLPVLALLVELLLIPSLVAQAITLAGAFVLRYLFQFRFVYRPKPAAVPVAATPQASAALAAAAAATAAAVAMATAADVLDTPTIPTIAGIEPPDSLAGEQVA